MADPTYSLVIAVCNEEPVLPSLFERLVPLLDRLDGPAKVMLELAARDERFRPLYFVSELRRFETSAGTPTPSYARPSAPPE